MKKFVLFFIALCCFQPLTWANHSSEYLDDSFSVNQLRSIQNTTNIHKKRLNVSPLTALYIELVVSSTVPEGEEIQSDQYQTKKHHGGATILLTTTEIGFGTDPILIMSGRILPATSKVRQLSLCKKRDGSVGICERGETVIGYRRTWNIAGYGNGEFSIQSTSKEYPHTHLMKNLYIQ